MSIRRDHPVDVVVETVGAAHVLELATAARAAAYWPAGHGFRGDGHVAVDDR